MIVRSGRQLWILTIQCYCWSVFDLNVEARCIMGQGSLSGTLWAFLLVNSSVRVRGVEVEEMEHCESASFVLESKELMRMNLSTCFTQISWDKVCHDMKRERKCVLK